MKSPYYEMSSRNQAIILIDHFRIISDHLKIVSVHWVSPIETVSL